MRKPFTNLQTLLINKQMLVDYMESIKTQLKKSRKNGQRR